MFQSKLEGTYHPPAKPAPLEPERAKLLLECTFADYDEKSRENVAKVMEGNDVPMLSKIVWLRVKNMPLPVDFTGPAYISINAFCKVPGEAVVLLIDCLNRFEGKTVTVADLCTIYPFGFYSEKELDEYVDLLKDNKLKWSEVYNVLGG